MDPVLERYLNERGIPHKSLDHVGAVFSDETLRWPRYGISGGPLLGWKCRDLNTGRFWGEPGGIAHGDCDPLRVKFQGSASGAMICEGESDTMRLACTSLPYEFDSDVICIPGATAFPSEWVPLLRNYDRVYVFADSDEAGLALPNRLAQLVPGVRRVLLPDGDDVCSFLLEHPEEDLRALYLAAALHVAPRESTIRRQSFHWDSAAADNHRAKLVRIVIDSGVELRRAGANEFKGLCPFHEERTPSFSVNAEKGLYRCFGCDAKGDVVTFLKQQRGMEFGEAMRYLRNYT